MTPMVGDAARPQDPGPRQARAERILDAAAELLLRWGYNRITIEDVATQAGIGKGTIYLHWKTREALFYAVFLREIAIVIDELLVAARQDPEMVLLHRMFHALFLLVMRRPLVRAMFVTDLEVLGKLARTGFDRELEIQQQDAFTNYLRLLREHGLLRTDLSVEETSYALDALANGFFLEDALTQEQWQFPLERKADILAITVQRAFEVEGPSAGAVQAVVPRMIELFSEIADSVRTQLRQAYDERRP